MSAVKKLYDAVADACNGQNSTDIMAVMTAVTASVLHDTMKAGVTLDDAMALFKKQVADHISRIDDPR